MNQESYERMQEKTPEQTLFREFVDEYEFSIVESRALVNRFQEYHEQLLGDSLRQGQIIHYAAPQDAPPGVALGELELVPVHLTVHESTDNEIARTEGMRALRDIKIQRMATEAVEQGAYLTQEDLASLTCSHVRTIRRAIKRLRDEQDVTVPTRGQKMDIGPGKSHKARIVERWLEGYQYSEISNRTNHAPGSIKRYVEDFSRIAYLEHQGHELREIRKVTGLSQRLVTDYLDLVSAFEDSSSPRLGKARQSAPDETIHDDAEQEDPDREAPGDTSEESEPKSGKKGTRGGSRRRGS